MDYLAIHFDLELIQSYISLRILHLILKQIFKSLHFENFQMLVNHKKKFYVTVIN